MKARPFGFVLVAALAVTSIGHAARMPADDAIRDMLKSRVDARQTPGIVVGVIDGSGRRVIAYGKTRGGGVDIDGNTVFEIGSITKAFTGTILADMVLHGEVRLDDPVKKFLPSTVRMPSRDGKEITLLDLATQSSGLPRLPDNMLPKGPANPYADYTVDSLYSFLSRHMLSRGIGERYEYSNLGVGLLGHALTRAAKTDYESLARKHVLDPLGMNDTRITLTPDMRARLATGHDPSLTPAPNWDMPALPGMGALRSTANDMLKLIAANFDPSTKGAPAALREARRERREAGVPDLAIGLAWHIRKAHGRQIVWHNGGTGGYRSFLGFDPDSGVGVVVLMNSAVGADDVGFHLLDSRFKLLRPRLPVAVDSTRLQDYVGRYELEPEFSITVTREGEQLFAQATNQSRFPIYAESDSSFFLRVVDAQVSFTRDESRRVTGLTLHQGGMHTPGRKVE